MAKVAEVWHRLADPLLSAPRGRGRSQLRLATSARARARARVAPLPPSRTRSLAARCMPSACVLARAARVRTYRQRSRPVRLHSRYRSPHGAELSTLGVIMGLLGVGTTAAPGAPSSAVLSPAVGLGPAIVRVWRFGASQCVRGEVNESQEGTMSPPSGRPEGTMCCGHCAVL